MHCGLSQYSGSSFEHLPDSVDGSVLALYAFGSEACQFLDPNDPHLHQEHEWLANFVFIAFVVKLQSPPRNCQEAIKLSPNNPLGSQ